MVMRSLIGAEATGRIRAGRYERTDSWITDRNGSRETLLATQTGDVELRIPKLRNVAFSLSSASRGVVSTRRSTRW